MNAVHVFPYAAQVSGGHSNAIRSFVACQRAAGINALGIAPKADDSSRKPDESFPLAEVHSLWDLRWTTVAERFGIAPDTTLLNLHSVDRRLGPLLRDLRRVGVPYVLTSHGQLGFQSAWHWLQKIVYLQFVNRCPQKAAGLHVLTKFAARRAKFLLPGFRGEILVQGNLVALPDLQGLPAAARGDYNIPEDSFVLIFMGRLDVRVKGLDLVVKAFSRLPSARARLVLAGPDWQDGRTKLEQLAQRLGCRNRIHFSGPVYDAKKWALLQMADVFLSPSRWEAFGIGQVEAMMVGLPVVSSTNGSLAPELQQARAALLVPPVVERLAEVIATLEADADQRRAMGARGKAWAESQCNPETAGIRFRGFYQKLLRLVY